MTTFEQVKSKLAKNLKDTLTREAVAPPGEKPVDFEVHIPYHNIREDLEEPGHARATVTYVVRCPTEKKHTVHIKFKYENSGRFVRNSMIYV